MDTGVTHVSTGCGHVCVCTCVRGCMCTHVYRYTRVFADREGRERFNFPQMGMLADQTAFISTKKRFL